MIFYQDIRYRAVYWFIFPVLLISLLWPLYQAGTLLSVLKENLVSLLFLALQMIILTIYLSVKEKGWVNITGSYLGWGDILLLLVIACYLSPLIFFAFYMLSLVLILLTLLVFFGLAKSRKFSIPLAGLQALLFLGLLGYDYFSTSFSAVSGDWIVNLIG